MDAIANRACNVGDCSAWLDVVAVFDSCIEEGASAITMAQIVALLNGSYDAVTPDGAREIDATYGDHPIVSDAIIAYGDSTGDVW